MILTYKSPYKIRLLCLMGKVCIESGFLSIIYFISCDNFSVRYNSVIRSFDIKLLMIYLRFNLFKHLILARNFGVLPIYIFYIYYHISILLHALCKYYLSESEF